MTLKRLVWPVGLSAEARDSKPQPYFFMARRATRALAVGALLLAEVLSATHGLLAVSYYHVKTGGTGGKPTQSEADPGLPSCWKSINSAFVAVKSRATAGPWVIQVDDEATYDEAVALVDLQTRPPRLAGVLPTGQVPSTLRLPVPSRSPRRCPKPAPWP